MSKTDGFLPHPDDWKKLGEFIGRNTHIKQLSLAGLCGSDFSSETRKFDDDAMLARSSGPNFPTLRDFQSFCSGLANNRSIKKVDFIVVPTILEELAMFRQTGREGGDGGLAYELFSGMFKNNVVEEINMPFCHCEDANYDNSGELEKFAKVLELEKFTSLKSFRVEFDNQYGDHESPVKVSGEIIDALSTHPNLEYLELHHSNDSGWSTEGYAALGRLLATSKALKRIKIEGDVDDELVLVMTAALGGTRDLMGRSGGNNTLEEIDIHEYDIDEVTSEGWNAFAKLLDDDSGSIMDTYYSNHTLKKVLSLLVSHTSASEKEEKEKKILGDELYTLLKVNTLCNKFEASRIKIIMRHLTGDFSMEPFTQMDLSALPTALAYMGRMNVDVASIYPNAEADLGLMYYFLRGVAPTIFDPLSEARKAKNKVASMEKVRRSKGKNRVSKSSYDTANEEEKHRRLHSKAISLVHEEAEDAFKSIRQRLNNLNLERALPKVKKARKKAAPMSVTNQLPSGGLEDKAVTSQFIIHVGEVTNLYNSTKKKKRIHQGNGGSNISIDLHGMSKESALQKLDEQLPKWVEIAMSGEHPFVIPVVIICGKGSQTLSVAVEDWIKRNERVANAPKNMLL